MGSPTYLVHLKQNIETWNRWRNDNPTIKPDLSKAYLCAAALSAANLSGANLHKVDLYSADLWGADLSHADMRAANLSSANLGSVNLAGANLAEAELLSANLNHADLRGANLHRANLSMTNLAGANLSGADLTGANLKGAKLTNAKLTNARMTGAELTGIMVSDVDVGVLATLEQVTCDHVYVLSCVQGDSDEVANTYTAYFRSALHQFYQSFVEACDNAGPQHYRIAWPSAGLTTGPDIYLQSVERQGNGDLMVRVGVPSLKALPPPAVEKPSMQQLFSTLGRGDFYRQQLQVKEEQMATVQRQNDELLELLKAMTRQNVYVQSVSVMENSIMTGISKYDMRGANIGSFADTVEAGGQQKSVQYNQHAMDTVSDFELVTQVEELLQQLAEQAAQVPAHQRPQVVSNALQKKARVNPEFKARLLKALEAGSGELIRVFTQNPYISIPLSLVKGWVSVA
ncbi:pentapeptide repeat-containing protein [Nodosilinea sp. LEGE 07298]|uniref:pentapeptide repeat-containing protein n=1 Tax=Nodosilinea sp. LEGE 07298 TaxID=2777970 RepID=UPI00187E2013|nr:pentapeptide repeat-containing protein [Nodosilinea sp. LEGE 07298]MBE9111784.1 pentapeptide repeat-containing protein [Nodosilinea sp. LEGE 07298]